MDDIVLPHDQKLEEGIFYSCFTEQYALDIALEQLDADDFFFAEHRDIFEAIEQLNQNGQSIDPINIESRMKKNGTFPEDNQGLIVSLQMQYATPANQEDYCANLKELATRRKFYQQVYPLLQKALGKKSDVTSIFEEVKVLLEQLESRHVHGESKSSTGIAADVLGSIMQVHRGEIRVDGTPSGLDFDEWTSGFKSTDMTIIGGRPSQGKTALVLSCILYLIRHNYDKKIILFSYEMTAEAIVERLLTMTADVDSNLTRKGRLTKYKRDELIRSANVLGVDADYYEEEGLVINDLSDCPLEIIDDNRIDVDELTRRMRSRIKKDDPDDQIGIIFVDYLQYIPVTEMKGIDTEEQRVNYIAKQLKNLNKAVQVPVVPVASLSRASVQRGNSKPQLSDLRQGGNVEYDADTVIFVHRPEYYGQETLPDGSPSNGVAILDIAKQRNGPTETARAKFTHKCARFDSYVGEHGATELPNPDLNDEELGGRNEISGDSSYAPF